MRTVAANIGTPVPSPALPRRDARHRSKMTCEFGLSSEWIREMTVEQTTSYELQVNSKSLLFHARPSAAPHPICFYQIDNLTKFSALDILFSSLCPKVICV